MKHQKGRKSVRYVIPTGMSVTTWKTEMNKLAKQWGAKLTIRHAYGRTYRVTGLE